MALTIHIILTLAVAITIAPDPPFTGDSANIVRRAVQVSEGVSPLAFPDPPLRYPPISALILFFSPLGVSPAWITLVVSLVVEFVAIPVTYWAMLKEWLPERAVTASLYVGALLMFSTYPWADTALEMSFWMYAYPIPFVFLAFRHATRATNRDDVLTGITLGIVALLQFFIAGFAALTVALMRWRSPAAVGRITIVSIVTKLPLIPYFMRYLDYVREYGGERAAVSPSVSTLEVLAILFALTLLVSLGVIQRHFSDEWEAVPFPLTVFAALSIGGTLLVSVFDNWWLQLVLSYLSKYAIFALIGLLSYQFLVRWERGFDLEI